MYQGSEEASQFIDKLIEAKGYDDLEDSVKKELHGDLLRLLEEITSRNIVESIPNHKLQTFMHIVDTNNPEKIQKFLNEESIDITEIVTRSMAELQIKFIGT